VADTLGEYQLESFNNNGGETIPILTKFVANNYIIKYVVNILVWSDTLLHNKIIINLKHI